MASAAHWQIIGGGGAPIVNTRRRPQVNGGSEVRPAQGSSFISKTAIISCVSEFQFCCF